MSIFYDIYSDISPGCSVAVFHQNTGRVMGACFYQPRKTHFLLGIMSVRPNYSGKGVRCAMVDQILDFRRQNDYKACRLVSSAFNFNSFSLYNCAGCVPRGAYPDMVINVPENGLDVSVPGEDSVRSATFDDVSRIGEFEMEISGIRRENDYSYSTENPRGVSKPQFLKIASKVQKVL